MTDSSPVVRGHVAAYLDWAVCGLSVADRCSRRKRKSRQIMNEIPLEGTEERLSWLEARAGEAYARMYDSEFGAPAAACYSDAKEFLYDAIGLAQRLGKPEEAERLCCRLAHIKAVFRSQFSA
ncbi:MAG: hypothetical protein ACLPWS_00735 [Rhodomicrobium sp.]